MTLLPRTARALLCAVALSGCTGASPAGEAARPLRITGAGATFPLPIYSKWFADYNRLHPDIEINYQSQGSGAGIRQLSHRTIFFGASDQPMTDAQLTLAPGPILHFPTVLGAVVPVYNLPGMTARLRFTGPLLADIVLGRVTRWDDPAVGAANPGVQLPGTDIVVIHRSDGSGTTYIWVDYLAKVSLDFRTTVGVDAAVSWPVGVGAKGNEGVAGLVQQTPGAFGYLELVYALQSHLAYGSVRNRAGVFITPTSDAVSAAAAAPIPDDFRVSITDAPRADAYPISSFTWILVYQEPVDKPAAGAMVAFLRWALTDGQESARALGYTPLPRHVVTKELDGLRRIRTE